MAVVTVRRSRRLRRPGVAAWRRLAGLIPVLSLSVSLWLAAVADGARADAAFTAWLAQLWPEARALGVSRATFDAAFKGVEPDLSLPDLVLPGRPTGPVRGQAEFTKPPQDYLNRGQLARLAEEGKALATRHTAALARIEAEIGVERQVVLAIWGRETAYGNHRLPHSLIRALATQAYLGRRKDKFREELLAALSLIERRLIEPAAMRASWAGAIGLPQLMPSEFDKYAYDLDGDGRRDIWNSVPDALATIAKQLKDKGWVKGQNWGYEVRLPATVDCSFEGPANERPLAEWLGLGVTRTNGQPFPRAVADQPAYLMSPGGAYGPAFLVFENFKVIRRYNMSDLYAVFVGHLGDRIAGGGDFQTPWQNITQITESDVESIQQQLQKLGLPMDKIDGKVGSNTRHQIGVYQRARKIAVDCWPTAGLLRHLKTAASR